MIKDRSRSAAFQRQAAQAFAAQAAKLPQKHEPKRAAPERLVERQALEIALLCRSRGLSVAQACRVMGIVRAADHNGAGCASR